MNGNNEVKKLLLVVLVDIEILFKNDVYKNYSDNLKSIKKNIEKMTFDGDNSKKLLEEVKYDIEILSEEWKNDVVDSDFECLYNDFEKLKNMRRKIWDIGLYQAVENIQS